jgi:hypothetical protein
MDALLDALKKRRGAKIIVLDGAEDLEEAGEALEDVGEMVEDAEETPKAAKNMLGREPFEGAKEKGDLEMEYDEDMPEDEMPDEESAMEKMSGLEREVADEKIMARLKNGKNPKGITERMNYNLMKKK